MPNLDKANRRDEQRQKRKHGMKMHGKNIAILIRAQEKRDKEREERRRQRERSNDSDTG